MLRHEHLWFEMQEMIHLLLSSNHKTNIFHFLVSPFTGNVAKGAMIMAVSILVVFFLIWDVWFKFFFPFFLSFGSARGLSFWFDNWNTKNFYKKESDRKHKLIHPEDDGKPPVLEQLNRNQMLQRECQSLQKIIVLFNHTNKFVILESMHRNTSYLQGNKHCKGPSIINIIHCKRWHQQKFQQKCKDDTKYDIKQT